MALATGWSIKQLGVMYFFFRPPDGMLVFCKVNPPTLSGTNLYTWVERGTMRKKNCLAQEHNAVPWPRLEPGSLYSDASEITIRKYSIGSLYMSQVAHQTGAYPNFLSIKWLGVFLLPPGWDARGRSITGFPPAVNSLVPIYTPGWREALWEWSALSKNTRQCPGRSLNPDCSIWDPAH